MLKARLYHRLSDKELEDVPQNVANKKHQFLKYCQNKGYTAKGIVVDVKVSGGKEDRRGINKLLKLAEEKDYEILVIPEWSRLARSVLIAETYLKKFKDLGILIESMDGMKDPLVIQITNAVNEDYKRKRSIQAGEIRTSMAEQGKIAGRAPMGYEYPRVNGRIVDSNWIINKDSEIVLKIFDLALTGLKHTEIARQLNIPRNTVYGIITNPAYYGYFKYNGKLYLGSYKPLISKEVFDKVQDILKKGKN